MFCRSIWDASWSFVYHVILYDWQGRQSFHSESTQSYTWYCRFNRAHGFFNMLDSRVVKADLNLCVCFSDILSRLYFENQLDLLSVVVLDMLCTVVQHEHEEIRRYIVFSKSASSWCGCFVETCWKNLHGHNITQPYWLSCPASKIGSDGLCFRQFRVVLYSPVFRIAQIKIYLKKYDRKYTTEYSQKLLSDLVGDGNICHYLIVLLFGEEQVLKRGTLGSNPSAAELPATVAAQLCSLILSREVLR